MKKKTSFLSVAFVMATILMLTLSTSTQMLNSTLSAYANYMWDSKTMGGLLTSFFNIGSILTSFTAGVVIQKTGKKMSLLVTALLYGFAVILMVLVPGQGVSLFARVLQGIGKGIICVGTASVVAEVVPDEKMNEGMGIYGLGSTFAMAFGPMIALNLVGTDNHYNLMLIVCGLITGVSAVCALFLNYKPIQAKSSREEVSSDAGEYKGIWIFIEKNAIMPSLIYMIFFASCANVLVFLAVYSQEILNLSSARIAYFFTAAALAMLVVRLFAGKLADKYGELYVAVPGCIAVIGMQLLLCFGCTGTYGYAAFLTAGALYGVGIAAVQPAMNTIAVIDSPRERGSIANATFYFMMDIGILIASALFGKIIDAADTLVSGYRLTFLIAIVVCAISIIMSILFLNRKARARRCKGFGV